MLFNSEVNYTNPAAVGHIDPFTNLWVPGWVGVGTPQIDTSAYLSPNSSAIMWTQRSTINSVTYFEGVFQHLPLNLEPDKPYIFTIGLRNAGASQVDFVKVLMTDGAYSLVSGPPPLLAPSQPVLFASNITHTGFLRYTNCNFVPSKKWEHLLIHPERQAFGPVQWLGVDDVYLIPNFGFAGDDTLLCQINNTVTIGTGACNGQFGATFEWFAISDPSNILSNQAKYTFVADATEEYVLKRTMFGCDAYDTVKVEVRNLQKPDLGPDVILCDTIPYVLTTAFEPDAHFFWKPPINFIQYNQDPVMTIVYSSGTYIIRMEKDGCFLYDTVEVKMLPIVEIIPDTIRICNTDSVDFCATPGLTSYQWSNGATTNCIRVYETGIYSLTATDSNGCQTTVFCVLYRGEPFTVSLGDDIDICHNSCIQLSPKIEGSSTVSNYQYEWSTGDTNSTICVNSGTYWVCVKDTFNCEACDTIVVNLKSPTKPTHSTIGPICLYDQPFYLSNAQPTPGFYLGNGVTNYFGNSMFFPRVAGVGSHQITYYHTNVHGCTDTVIFTVEVIPGPYAELSDIHTCVTEAMVVVPLVNQSGLIGMWSTNAPDGEFCPSCEGPGVHEVTYTIIDSSTGCTYVAKANVFVGQTLTGSFSVLPSGGFLCEGKIVLHQATGGLRYLWVNDQTSDIISERDTAGLQANGNYTLYIMDSIGNCPSTQHHINLNYQNCCDITTQIPPDLELITDGRENGEYYIPMNNSTTISNFNFVLDKDLIIPYNYDLNLLNCDIVVNGCSRIVVENGAQLILNNTEIGYCQWKGIEAGGWYDCCQGLDGNGCQLGVSCVTTSHVIVINSKIHHADVAIMAGYKEDYSFASCNQTPITIPADFSGGAILEVTNSFFGANYVDILFREYDDELKHGYNGFEINSCGTPPHILNKSKILYNQFSLPATQQLCASLSSDLLNRIGAIGRCHIVDFAETSLFYVSNNVGKGQNLRGYLGPLVGINFYTTKITTLKSVFNHNTYTLPCSTLKFYK